MSKKLTKILTISMIALIIPVAIIVTAICLSNAVTYALSIEIKGLENAGSISIKVNGVDYTEGLRFSRNSDVTVSVNPTGYDFVGWYNGEASAISAASEALSTDKEYTFKITEDTTLTADNNIIVYSVKYNGEDAVSVKYGSELRVEDDADIENGIIFFGWTLEGSDDAMTVAEFNPANREVSLSAKQDIINYMVSYDGAEAEKTEFGTAITKTPEVDFGYKFTGWSYGDSIVTEAKFGKTFETINLTSNIEKVKYKVSYNGAQAVEVTFEDALKVESDKLSEGKLFEGWQINGESKVYTAANFPYTDLAELDNEIALTAKYSDLVYMVSYDGAEAVEVAFGAALKTENNDKTHGLNFKGWKIAGNETVYTIANFPIASRNDNAISVSKVMETFSFTNIKYGAESATVKFGTKLANPNETEIANKRAEGKVFRGWTREGDDNIYTYATFLVEDETAEIALTAAYENLYETNETYSKVTVSYNFYKYGSGSDMISTWYNIKDNNGQISHQLSPMDIVESIKLIDGTEDFNKDINDMYVKDCLQDVMTAYDSNGNEYALDSITVIYGSSENANIEIENMTIKELVDVYKKLGAVANFGEEVTINIKISYEKKAA